MRVKPATLGQCKSPSRHPAGCRAMIYFRRLTQNSFPKIARISWRFGFETTVAWNDATQNRTFVQFALERFLARTADTGSGELWFLQRYDKLDLPCWASALQGQIFDIMSACYWLRFFRRAEPGLVGFITPNITH